MITPAAEFSGVIILFQKLFSKAAFRHAQLMLLQVKRWLPDREVIAVGDGSYPVLDLLTALQGRVSFITRPAFRCRVEADESTLVITFGWELLPSTWITFSACFTGGRGTELGITSEKDPGRIAGTEMASTLQVCKVKLQRENGLAKPDLPNELRSWSMGETHLKEIALHDYWLGFTPFPTKDGYQ